MCADGRDANEANPKIQMKWYTQ